MAKRSARSSKRSRRATRTRRAKGVLTVQNRKRLFDSSARLLRVSSTTTRVARQMKSLARKDRIGNFEIQRLMSAFNQAETLASQTMRRVNDTLNSVTVKID